MSAKLYLASRKRLFRFDRRGKSWVGSPPSFLGAPITAMLKDPRDGARYAALKHGHFGLKLHRSDDDGANGKELPPPAFPQGSGGAESPPSVEVIWTLAAAGRQRTHVSGHLPPIVQVAFG